MSVTKAVAERENGPRPPSLVQVATEAVEATLPRFQAVLPRGWDRDRFTNLVVAAVKRSPDLVRCFATERGRASLLIAAIQCAGMGLEPNTPLKEAALVPRKIKGTDEAVLMVEYRGLVKLARRSGEIATLGAEVVHERDHFRYSLGLEPTLEHVPYDGDDDPGPLTHCYAVVEYSSGAKQFVVVPRRIVERRHRAHSDSWRSEKGRERSPWTTHPEAMWRKTAIRVLEPFLPLSIEVRQAIAAIDGASYDVEGDQVVTAGSLASGEVIDYDTGEFVERNGEPVEESRDEAAPSAPTSAYNDDEAPSAGVAPEDAADAEWVAEARSEADESAADRRLSADEQLPLEGEGEPS